MEIWEVVELVDEKARSIRAHRPLGGGPDKFTARGTVFVEIAPGRSLPVPFEHELPGVTPEEAFAGFDEAMNAGAEDARRKALQELRQPRIFTAQGAPAKLPTH